MPTASSCGGTPTGAHIVADGIGFTNEARVDPTGAWLYVNETCAKRISRFPVKGDKLGARETVHDFGPGEFPDGFAFDGEGGVWVACVNANRVIRIELERPAHADPRRLDPGADRRGRGVTSTPTRAAAITSSWARGRR